MTEFSKEKLTHELPRRKPHPPIPREPADALEGGIRRPQGKSADRGHLRSHPQSGPPLMPAHPGTAGRTDTARSPGKRLLYIISRSAARAPARRGGAAPGPPPVRTALGDAGATLGETRLDAWDPWMPAAPP